MNAAPEPLVIVGCGAAKRTYPAPAADLYTGQHFRAAWSTAQAIAPGGGILILSARYGLVAPDRVISPYDLTLCQSGAVDAGRIFADARRLGVVDAPRVVVLASACYAALCLAVWPHAVTPLAGQGIGYQRATLARLRRDGLPDAPEDADDRTPAERM
jgi:hypothetical protein